MQTIIHSNGSKWLGEELDTIEQLIKVLDTHKLDLARFAAFGFITFQNSNGFSNRAYEEHTVSISGNFSDISHVFHIEGIYNNLQPVITAIENNIKKQMSCV